MHYYYFTAGWHRGRALVLSPWAANSAIILAGGNLYGSCEPYHEQACSFLLQEVSHRFSSIVSRRQVDEQSIQFESYWNQCWIYQSHRVSRFLSRLERTVNIVVQVSHVVCTRRHSMAGASHCPDSGCTLNMYEKKERSK